MTLRRLFKLIGTGLALLFVFGGVFFLTPSAEEIEPERIISTGGSAGAEAEEPYLYGGNGGEAGALVDEADLYVPCRSKPAPKTIKIAYREAPPLLAIYELMKAEPAPWEHPKKPVESKEERDARLYTIATAIHRTSSHEYLGWKHDPYAMAALLLRTSYEESGRWSLDVHQGKRRGDKGRAACLNQLWAHYRMMPRARWKASMGTDLESTLICMDGAARWFAHYSKTCVPTWMAERDVVGSFTRIVSGYGTGRTCLSNSKSARTRAFHANRYLKKLNEYSNEHQKVRSRSHRSIYSHGLLQWPAGVLAS